MESKSKKTLRLLKKIGKITGIIMLCLVIISLVLAAIFEDKIGKAAIKALNQTLKHDILVEDLSLSFITSFPNTAIELTNVVIPDTNKDTLLNAQTLALAFKTTSLFGDKIKVNRMEISKGTMRVITDKRGNANFDIFEPTTSDEPTSQSGNTAFSLSIKEAAINDLKVLYKDEQEEQAVSMDIDKIFLSGNFEEDKFDLKSFAEVTSNYIEMDSLRYLNQVDWAYNATVKMDMEKGNYQLDDVELVMETNTFSLTGNVQETENDETDVDLELKGIDCDISSVIKVLPMEWVNSIRDFKSRGGFYFNAKALGTYGKSKVPEISAEFGLKKGRITSPRLNEAFKDVSFTAKYEAGKRGVKDFFELPDFTASLKGEPIEIKLRVDDMKDPYIDFLFNANISMGSIYKTLDADRITKASGAIDFEAISVVGKYRDMLDINKISRVETAGIITFDKTMMAIDKKPIVLEKGTLSFIDNDLLVREMTLKGLNSDFAMNGNFKNIIPVLFADSTNTHKSELSFDAELTSKNIDFDKILALTAIEGETEAEIDSLTKERNEQRESFTNYLKGVFNLKVDAINYRKLKLKNVGGTLAFNNNEMILREVSVEGMSGKVELTSNIHFEKAPYLHLFIDCQNINVREFLAQNENFGQNYMVAENLKGTLNTKIAVDIYFDEQGNLLEDKLFLIADINIKNGELIRYKVLEEFSSYVKIDDLQHIRFTDIRNQLKIQNRTLIIPAMFIQSNAMNLTMAGKHTFDNDLDYKMKVNAGQVIWNKYLRGNPRGEKPVKAKKKGFLNLYFKVWGNANNPKFETNKKEVKDVLAAELEQEFEAVKNTIKTRFDTPIFEEPLDWDDEGDDDDSFEF